MKFFSTVFLSVASSTAVIASRQAGETLDKGGQTIVLKEIGGVPGNECLTFHNYGKIIAHLLFLPLI